MVCAAGAHGGDAPQRVERDPHIRVIGRASEEAWSKVFVELGEMLIFAPGDLAELGAHQRHLIPENP